MVLLKEALMNQQVDQSSLFVAVKRYYRMLGSRVTVAYVLKCDNFNDLLLVGVTLLKDMITKELVQVNNIYIGDTDNKMRCSNSSKLATQEVTLEIIKMLERENENLTVRNLDSGIISFVRDSIQNEFIAFLSKLKISVFESVYFENADIMLNDNLSNDAKGIIKFRLGFVAFSSYGISHYMPTLFTIRIDLDQTELKLESSLAVSRANGAKIIYPKTDGINGMKLYSTLDKNRFISALQREFSFFVEKLRSGFSIDNKKGHMRPFSKSIKKATLHITLAQLLMVYSGLDCKHEVAQLPGLSKKNRLIAKRFRLVDEVQWTLTIYNTNYLARISIVEDKKIKECKQGCTNYAVVYMLFRQEDMEKPLICRGFFVYNTDDINSIRDMLMCSVSEMEIEVNKVLKLNDFNIETAKILGKKPEDTYYTLDMTRYISKFISIQNDIDASVKDGRFLGARVLNSHINAYLKKGKTVKDLSVYGRLIDDQDKTLGFILSAGQDSDYFISSKDNLLDLVEDCIIDFDNLWDWPEFKSVKPFKLTGNTKRLLEKEGTLDKVDINSYLAVMYIDVIREQFAWFLDGIGVYPEEATFEDSEGIGDVSSQEWGSILAEIKDVGGEIAFYLNFPLVIESSVKYWKLGLTFNWRKGKPRLVNGIDIRGISLSLEDSDNLVEVVSYTSLGLDKPEYLVGSRADLERQIHPYMEYLANEIKDKVFNQDKNTLCNSLSRYNIEDLEQAEAFLSNMLYAYAATPEITEIVPSNKFNIKLPIKYGRVIAEKSARYVPDESDLDIADDILEDSPFKFNEDAIKYSLGEYGIHDEEVIYYVAILEKSVDCKQAVFIRFIGKNKKVDVFKIIKLSNGSSESIIESMIKSVGEIQLACRLDWYKHCKCRIRIVRGNSAVIDNMKALK